MQGLLPNSRMVNAIFDDANEGTKHLWKYPDTGTFDPDRNTNEFVAQLVDYRAHGLLAVTVSLMGGSVCGNDPEDKSHAQCSMRSYDKVVRGFTKDGDLVPAYFDRLERILAETDRLGMAVFLQIFYPKQAFRLRSESAVMAVADNTVDWLSEKGFANVVFDVCNECDWNDNAKFLGHLPSLLWPKHGDLINRIRRRTESNGRKLIVSSAFIGGYMPNANQLGYLDYANLHANNLWCAFGPKQAETLPALPDTLLSRLSC